MIDVQALWLTAQHPVHRNHGATAILSLNVSRGVPLTRYMPSELGKSLKVSVVNDDFKAAR